MQLTESDQVWAPLDKPDYLLVFPKGESPPRDGENLLHDQVRLLHRLLLEANEGELNYAQNRVSDNLPPEEFRNVPELRDQGFPSCLLMGSPADGSVLQEWRKGLDEAVKLPPMPADEARQEAEQLSLESFLSRVL